MGRGRVTAALCTAPAVALLLACSAPAVAFFAAFWLLPAGLLLALPAREGWRTYFATLTDALYLQSLLQTLALSLAVTLATLLIGAVMGIALARHRFTGRGLLLSLLTLPLSFPGVIIGFFIILLGGRQGALADLSVALGGERITFAYGLLGLFLGYLYFSLPRAIASYTAAAEALDPHLEEAARSLGGNGWSVARDVWWPQLLPTTLACGAIVFATSVGAFGTAFALTGIAVKILPLVIYTHVSELSADIAKADALAIVLTLVTTGVIVAYERFFTSPSKA